MVSELTREEDTMELWELGIPSLWIFLHIFSAKEGWLTLLPRAHLFVEAESNSEVFQFWTCHCYQKLGIFTEEEFFSDPRPVLISSPKSKLATNFKAFGWTELQKSKTLICSWASSIGFQLKIQIRHLDLVRYKIFCISIWGSQLRCLIITSLMKILREMINFELGSIGSPSS